jgi:glycosyltransferase involved in cell wall biosynthesis
MVALSELRLIKDNFEITQMRKAVDATIKGFGDIVKVLPQAVGHPRGERVIDAAFYGRARVEGNELGYDTIAASGAHACVLHWIRNDGVVKSGDLILCFFGQDHSAAVRDEPDWLVVEPSIGYRPECIFAPYRVFTSHAVMNYFYGMRNMLLNPSWFDAVIPNAFSPEEFGFSDTKQDYLVYLGRVSADKGIDLAIQVAEYTGKRLVIAGPGDLKALNYSQIPQHVEMYGYADMLRRKQVLRNAYALIAPTHYLEPFGNIVVEVLNICIITVVNIIINCVH